MEMRATIFQSVLDVVWRWYQRSLLDLQVHGQYALTWDATFVIEDQRRGISNDPFKDILHDDTRSVLQDAVRREAARRVKQRPPQRRTVVRKRPAAQRVKRPAAQAGVRNVNTNDR